MGRDTVPPFFRAHENQKDSEGLELLIIDAWSTSKFNYKVALSVQLVLEYCCVVYRANILTTSVFGALLIGVGFVAAVLLVMKREDI